jgi:hypothetical protein
MGRELGESKAWVGTGMSAVGAASVGTAPGALPATVAQANVTRASMEKIERTCVDFLR